MLIIYLLSSLTGSSFTLNIYGIIMIIVGIAAGAIGGVVRSQFEIRKLFEWPKGT